MVHQAPEDSDEKAIIEHTQKKPFDHCRKNCVIN